MSGEHAPARRPQLWQQFVAGVNGADRAREMRAAFAVDPLIDQCLPVWSPVPNWGPVVPGHSPQLSAGDVPEVFGSLGEYYGLVLNLHHEYFLAGGHDLELMCALADAVAYNGGRRSSCAGPMHA